MQISEGGFAVDPDEVGANVKLAASTGIAGLSIEDSTGDEADPLHDFDLAVERVGPHDRRSTRAASACCPDREIGGLIGRPDIDETIRRLDAYAEAGADCLYVPGSTIWTTSSPSSPRYHRNRSTS